MNEFKILDSYISEKEIVIDTEEKLLTVLYSLINPEARIILLESNFGNLTIGVGEPLGFVEFEDESKEPPYVVAV